jgi:hypothetical protein
MKLGKSYTVFYSVDLKKNTPSLNCDIISPAQNSSNFFGKVGLESFVDYLISIDKNNKLTGLDVIKTLNSPKIDVAAGVMIYPLSHLELYEFYKLIREKSSLI